MKKIVKTGTLVALTLCAVLALCSCKALDDAKYNHGIYLDEKKETIEFRGNRYTEITSALPSYDGSVSYETEDGTRLSFLQSGWGGAYITEADVPVLLKNSFGDMINAIGGDAEIPVIIGVYRYEYENGESRDHYYCIEEKEKEIRAALKHPAIDEYYLDISGWDHETDRFASGKELVDAKVKDVISRTLDKAYDEKTDYPDFYDLTKYEDVEDEYFYLKACDRELLFTDDTVVQIVRTNGKHRKYYIASEVDEYSDYAVDIFSSAIWHQVEEKDASVLEEFFERHALMTKPIYFDDYYYDGYEEEETGPLLEEPAF